MGKEKFEEYLKSQQNMKNEPIDWELKKEEWVKDIEVLLNQIKGYFEKYKDNVSLEEQILSINEEYLGIYATKKLIIKFNNDTVTFTPIGRNIIGAKGRIDMEGKAGKVKFVLVGEHSSSPKITMTIISNKQEQEAYEQKIKEQEEIEKQEKDVWKISTPLPKIKYLELNEDSFFDALMEVING